MPQRLLEAARRLCPEPIEGIAELRRGHNNRIFQLTTRNRRFALKAYSTTDLRDRQGAEARALEFLERAGIPATPRLVAWDATARCSLMTWLDGTPVTSVTDGDVDQFAQTQVALDRAADGCARERIGEASEACLSGRRILSHIGWRVDRLAEVKPRLPRLAAFCDAALLPALDRLERDARAVYADLENRSVMELARMVQRQVGAHVRLLVEPTNDPRSYHVCADKIRRDLGFEPIHSTEEAIGDLIAAFKAGRLPNSLEDPRYFNIKMMQRAQLR